MSSQNAEHSAFCSSVISALNSVIAHESHSQNFYAKPASPMSAAPETIHSRSGAEVRSRLLFQLPRDKSLKVAAELGCRFAYFIPAKSSVQFSHEHGIPEIVPDEWVPLGRNINPGADPDHYLFNISAHHGGVAGARGTVVLRPNTGSEVMRDVFRKMAESPDDFNLTCPTRAIAFKEEGIFLPSGSQFRKLTSEQSYCVAFACANPVTFIWGPPGTGKSATLCGIISLMLAKGFRILVMATANDAIDSIAEKLYSHYTKKTCDAISSAVTSGRVTRYGTSERSKKFREIAFASKIKKAKAAGASPASVGATMANDLVSFSTLFRFLQQQTLHYDVVIVDEAGAVNIPTLYAAAAVAKKHFIICGDPRQTEPIFNYSPEDVGRRAYSLFSTDIYKHNHLRINPGDEPDGRICMLTTQFRMHDGIAELVRLTGVYPRYESPKNISYLPKSAASATSLGPLNGHPFTVVDTSPLAPTSSGNKNTRHCELAKLLALYAATRPEIHQVGIVTPYRNQADLYREWSRTESVSKVLVGTVHNFQGSEAPYVIFDTQDAQGVTGEKGPSLFFTDDIKYSARSAINVLNVAVSRAQGKLVILADVPFLRQHLTQGCFLHRVFDHAERLSAISRADDILAKFGWRLGARNSQSAYFPKSPDFFPSEHFWKVFDCDSQRAFRSIDIRSHDFDKRFFYRLLEHLRPFCESKGLVVSFFIGLRLKKDDRIWITQNIEASPFFLVRRFADWHYHHRSFVAFDGRVTYDSKSDDVPPFLSGFLPNHMLRFVFDSAFHDKSGFV